jgi:uncharacterized protein YyaL (SSP411 family)
MKRPAFKVTGGVVCALTFVGVMRVLLEPQLPSSPASPLITLSPDEKLAPPVLDITWRKNIDDALQESKAKDKGLLVFLAEPTSYRARLLETEIFRDDEVVRFVRRHFVSVRINLDDQPEWEGKLFPLARTQAYFVPGCSLFVADTKGTILSDTVFRLARAPFKEAIMAFLVKAKQDVSQRARSLDYETTTSEQMTRDMTRLQLSPASPFPDTDKFLETARKELEPLSGTFGTGGIIQFRPLMLRVLMQQGKTNEALELAKRALRSPIYDVIDGGFFESMEWGESRDIDTSKRACRNALAAEVLAEMACLTGDAEIREAALDVAKFIITDLREGDVFIAGQANDIAPNRRSHRYSLTQAKLEKALSPKDLKWVQSRLLVQNSVGREIATFSDLSLYENPDYKRIRNVLRLNLPDRSLVTRPDRVGIMGYVSARLFRVGLLLGREDMVDIAAEQADKCFTAITGSGVNRLYGQSEQGTGWLGTYLGVADVALADYLYSGRTASLDLARKVFRFVSEQFGVPATSYFGCQVLSEANPLTPNTPQLVDFEGESLAAMSVRLGFILSVLDSDKAEREALMAQLSSVSGTLAPLLSDGGSCVAGYYSVTRCFLQPHGYVVPVGQLATVSQKNPLEWVIPASIGVRSDWKLQSNAIYEFQGTELTGTRQPLAKPDADLP